MENIKTYHHSILSKCIDDRDKLLARNKADVDQEALRHWEQGFMEIYEFLDKIKSDSVRENFMYLSLVIYATEEKLNNLKNRNS